MSYRSDYIFLLSIFLGIIVISVITEMYNVSYLPYAPDNIFNNRQHVYEGYSSILQSDLIHPDQPVNTQTSIQESKPFNMDSTNSRFLFSSYNEITKPDVFVNSKGSLKCSGSGYSNSDGPLCLNADQINLLKTRGGNSTGDNSQIGSN